MRARLSQAAQRREAMVAAVARILDGGEPTVFAFEGACRTGLRIGHVLAFWPWAAADAAAAGIVAEALKRLGVERPSWQAGQPEHVEPVGELRSACIRCGKRLPDDMPAKGRNRKYCSVECKQNQAAEAKRKDERRRTAAERAAAEAAKMAARAKRRCPECGEPIKSREKEAKYCGRACANRATSRRNRKN